MVATQVRGVRLANRPRGFMLMELLVAIAVIAALVGLVIHAAQEASLSARQALGNVKIVAGLIDTGDTPACNDRLFGSNDNGRGRFQHPDCHVRLLIEFAPLPPLAIRNGNEPGSPPA